jgi:cytochrome c-type biogenesis protein CcmH/NrfG
MRRFIQLTSTLRHITARHMAAVTTVLASIVIALLVSQQSAYAGKNSDIAPPGQAPGSTISPTVATHVQMVKERVVIDVLRVKGPVDGLPIANVIATFTMRNNGTKAESMQVLFPLTDPSGVDDGFGIYPEIDTYKVRVNGREVKTTIVETPNPLGGDRPNVKWAGFDVTFPPGDDVQIQVEYILKSSGVSPQGVFRYFVETGAGWDGPIGEAEFILRLPYPASEENVALDATTPGSEFVGREIRWVRQDFEPSSSDNLAITVISPQVWGRILDARSAVERRPRTARLWRNLAQAYLAAISLKNGPVGGQQFIEKVEEAYRRAQQLQPSYSPWRAELAKALIDIYWPGIGFGDNPDITRKALVEIEAALKLNARNELAARLLGDLRASLSEAAQGSGDSARNAQALLDELARVEALSALAPVTPSAPPATAEVTTTLEATATVPAIAPPVEITPTLELTTALTSEEAQAFVEAEQADVSKKPEDAEEWRQLAQALLAAIAAEQDAAKIESLVRQLEEAYAKAQALNQTSAALHAELAEALAKVYTQKQVSDALREELLKKIVDELKAAAAIDAQDRLTAQVAAAVRAALAEAAKTEGATGQQAQQALDEVNKIQIIVVAPQVQATPVPTPTVAAVATPVPIPTLTTTLTIEEAERLIEQARAEAESANTAEAWRALAEAYLAGVAAGRDAAQAELYARLLEEAYAKAQQAAPQVTQLRVDLAEALLKVYGQAIAAQTRADIAAKILAELKAALDVNPQDARAAQLLEALKSALTEAAKAGGEAGQQAQSLLDEANKITVIVTPAATPAPTVAVTAAATPVPVATTAPLTTTLTAEEAAALIAAAQANAQQQAQDAAAWRELALALLQGIAAEQDKQSERTQQLIQQLTEAYQQAQQINPQAAQYRVELAEALLKIYGSVVAANTKLQIAEQIINELKAAAAINPNDPKAAQLLAELKSALAELAKAGGEEGQRAQTLLEAANQVPLLVVVAPVVTPAPIQPLTTTLTVEEAQTLIAAAQANADQQAQDAEAWRTLAEALLQGIAAEQDKQSARTDELIARLIEAYEKAEQIQPQSIELRGALAEALLKLYGEALSANTRATIAGQALNEIKEALAIDPKDVRAASLLAALKNLLTETAKAQGEEGQKAQALLEQVAEAEAVIAQAAGVIPGATLAAEATSAATPPAATPPAATPPAATPTAEAAATTAPTEAAPTEAAPTEAAPTEAAPTEAAPAETPAAEAPTTEATAEAAVTEAAATAVEATATIVAAQPPAPGTGTGNFLLGLLIMALGIAGIIGAALYLFPRPPARTNGNGSSAVSPSESPSSSPPSSPPPSSPPPSSPPPPTSSSSA